MNIIKNPSNEHIERVRRELQQKLDPYYKRLSEIQSLKTPKILVNKIDKSITYDYGEDTTEEKIIKDIIECSIKKSKKELGQIT